MKLKGLLQYNIHKVYLILLGKYNELMKYKLKIIFKWSNISDKLDVLKLLPKIKVIKLIFEDQKYLPLSITKAKINFIPILFLLGRPQ